MKGLEGVPGLPAALVEGDDEPVARLAGSRRGRFSHATRRWRPKLAPPNSSESVGRFLGGLLIVIGVVFGIQAERSRVRRQDEGRSRPVTEPADPLDTTAMTGTTPIPAP